MDIFNDPNSHKQNELLNIYNMDRHIENITYNLHQYDTESKDYKSIKIEIEELTLTLAHLKCEFKAKYNESINLFAIED